MSFIKAGSLALEFREHRFNSIWLPRFQHEREHRRYDALVWRYPRYLIPGEDVMATFMDEARLLDELDVCIKAVDMIDEALYAGRVKNVGQTMENRAQRIETIGTVIELSSQFEVMPRYLAKTAIQGANQALAKAA